MIRGPTVPKAAISCGTNHCRTREAWKAILSIDFHPVFAPALAALKALNDDDAIEPMRWIARNAVAVADELASLRFDHAGSLYHRLLASAAVTALQVATDIAQLGHVPSAFSTMCEAG